MFGGSCMITYLYRRIHEFNYTFLSFDLGKTKVTEKLARSQPSWELAV